MVEVSGPQGNRVSIAISPRFVVGSLDHRVFGGFLEQAGRAVYTGILEPGHALADEGGYRRDVIDLTRELGITTVRYPGGNFVSGYRWEDGTGPVELRPVRPELAWHATEPNRFGLDEFMTWTSLAGVEPMLAVNLGTRDVLAALDLLEYCNLPGGTAQADRRRGNGFEAPFGVKLWCLGNEPDGPWQLGHMDALTYGRKAHQAGAAMKMMDPSIELTVAGSSMFDMPSFGEWERVVLEETYADVDFISAHAYYAEKDADLAGYLAASVHFDAYLRGVIATIDHVRARLRSPKAVDVSVDEWGIWYADDHGDDIPPGTWPTGARRLEDHYSVADAVVLGSLLITLLQHADRVRAASLAQLVNVIAPIMTEPGGPAWRQTTFEPFRQMATHAGDIVLQTEVDSPVVHTDRFGDAAAVDAVATFDAVAGTVRVFAINRSTDRAAECEIDLSAWEPVSAASAIVLHDVDPHRIAAPGDPVTSRDQTVSLEGRRVRVTLPPVSWSMTTVQLGTAG